MKTVLHVGSGRQDKRWLTAGFQSADWQEVRLDIDPTVRPDIVGSITDLGAVPSESFDAVFSSHNLEHVYHHEVQDVLAGFLRVLEPGGFVVLTGPDLQSVCAAVAQGRLTEELYESGAGPISALDVLYGREAKLRNGNLYMAHKCGFTYKTLSEHFEAAGFNSLIGGARPAAFDLWILAIKSQTPLPHPERQALAARYLPS